MTKNLSKNLSKQEKDELRYKSSSDLWYLNTEVFGVPLIESLHRPLCEEFFVRKDPVKSLKEQPEQIRERLLLFPRFAWKALDIDTPIPTPSGFVLMRDIQAGDTVFSDDGKPCRVTGTSQVYYDRPCYEVVFTSGDTIVCDGDHLWETENLDHKVGVRTTLKIKSTLKQGRKDPQNNHKIRACLPVEYPDADLPIHPYVFGCWLGDGAKDGPILTIGGEDKVRLTENISRFEEIHWTRDDPRGSGNTGRYHLGSQARDSHDGRKFKKRLRGLGVLGNKHIPEVYLHASVKQRTELLQGLMDTDGTAGSEGRLSFSNTNRDLVESVRELLCSLGLTPWNIGKYDKGDCSPEYVIGFIAFDDQPVFRLYRKLVRQKGRSEGCHWGRKIEAVNPVSSRPTKCLMVDSPSSLYLAGRAYIPTHNTTLQASDAVQWLITFPDITVAINTGDGELSDAIVALVKSYFAVPGYDGKRKDNGDAIWNSDARPTLFNRLFSEFAVPVSGGQKGRADTYFSPARKTKMKDPSLYSLSILSSSAGWRCSVMLNDDVVNETNMDSPAVLDKIAKRVTMSRKLLPKFGFRQTVGTRYSVSDVYGKMLRDNGVLGEVPYGKFEVKGHPGFKCWIMPSWWVKGTGPEAGLTECKAPTLDTPEDQCEFLCREIWDYDSMRSDMKDDPQVHGGQYLNNPNVASKQEFKRADLIAATISPYQMPKVGRVFMTGDLAYGVGHAACESAFAVGRWYEDCLYVEDVVAGKFAANEVGYKIVSTIKAYGPERLHIEDSQGAQWLVPELGQWGLKLGVIPLPPIDWVPTGNVKGGKETRILGLLPLLLDGKLKFSSNIEGIERIYAQLTGQAKARDMADSMARLLEFREAAKDVNALAEREANYERLEQEGRLWGMVFGEGKFAQPKPPEPEPPGPLYDPVTGLPMEDLYAEADYR
jgi:hypothetical protein